MQQYCRFGFFFLILLAFVPARMQAQRAWRQVYRDSSVTVALDTSRIMRLSNGGRTIVLRWTYSRPRPLENRRPYSRMVQQAQVRCSPQPIRVRRFAMALYSSSGVLLEEAKPLPPASIEYMDWDALRPNSEGARVFPAVCRVLALRRR